jgi:lauroyl/myristoyl acyltransferase
MKLLGSLGAFTFRVLYEFIIDKEIPLVMTGNRRKDMEENTRMFYAVIEKHIKKYPTQWEWIHNCWKTTPAMIAEKKQKQEKNKGSSARPEISATA